MFCCQARKTLIREGLRQRINATVLFYLQSRFYC
jgi:hypothetical protein